MPTYETYKTLFNYGYSWVDAGGQYNLPGIWCGPNHDNINLRTNSSLFLPAAGFIDNSRNFEGYYWTSTDFYWTGADYENGFAWGAHFNKGRGGSTQNYEKKCAFSVRCVKTKSLVSKENF